MKTVLWILLIVGVVILFGTWPLAVIAKIFEWIGTVLAWIAKLLDFFHWNGILRIGVLG